MVKFKIHKKSKQRGGERGGGGEETCNFQGYSRKVCGNSRDQLKKKINF